MDTPVVREPRFHLHAPRSARRLIVATVLLLAVATSGFAVWAWGAGAPAEGSSEPASSNVQAQDGWQVGWTNAVEECDCLFGQ